MKHIGVHDHATVDHKDLGKQEWQLKHPNKQFSQWANIIHNFDTLEQTWWQFKKQNLIEPLFNVMFNGLCDKASQQKAHIGNAAGPLDPSEQWLCRFWTR